MTRVIAKQRPKFCAGEWVGLVSVLRPELSTSGIEVERVVSYADRVELRGISYMGWIYSLVGSQFTWCEMALRKLPQDPE